MCPRSTPFPSRGWCGSHIMWLRTRPFPDFAPIRRRNLCNFCRGQPSRHLMSAQRGKSTWRVIPALDCQLTSALLHVGFHAMLAHEDVDQDTRRSTNCWNVDRRHSERGKFHPNWRSQDPSRWARVCDIVRSTAIEGVLLARQIGILPEKISDSLCSTPNRMTSCRRPRSDLSLDQGIGALIVLNIKLDAMHDSCRRPRF